MADVKIEEFPVDDSKEAELERIFTEAPRNPQPLLSNERDKVVTDSLLNCNPSIAKVSVVAFHPLKEGPVVYEIRASNKKCEWNVWHRFQTFQLLHQMLKEYIEETGYTCKLPILPNRHIKLVINHKSNDFCEGRRVLLDNYLKNLLSTKELSNLSILVGFLSHSDESLSKEKVSKEEIDQYRRDRLDKIMITDENDEVTGVFIPTLSVVRNEYVLYQVRVQNLNKAPDYSQWYVMHRYSEFKEFDKALRESIMESKPQLLSQIPQLPMKEPKIIKDHFDHEFVERRRLLLDSYIKRVIRIPELRRSSVTSKFLGVKE